MSENINNTKSQKAQLSDNLSQKKRLLILSNNPSRASFRQRIGIYFEKLSSLAIEYDLVKFPVRELDRIKVFRKASDYDLVFLQKKCLNIVDALMLKHYSKKIIYDFDDAIMYSPSKPQSKSLSHFFPFKNTAKIADCILAGNSYLAEHASRFNKNVHILPTALNCKSYDIKKTTNDNKIRLVWIGSQSTLKYLAQIKDALEEIGKHHKNVALRIIADDFFDLKNMPVEKHQWSMQTQASDLVNCDIGLAPLSDNRFTRGKCGFKILQYQASSLPIVASPVGFNRDLIINGKTGFYADSNKQWVNRIKELIGNPDLRNSMAAKTKQLVNEFDTELIGSKLCSYITNQLNGLNKSSTNGRVKVSICIPTYNRKDYLKETLRSIKEQTFKDYEVIIVDDGSTDGTKDMINSFDLPIRYYWQENTGDAAARNKLLDLAKGKYLAFIDSDDLFMPNALEKMVNILETNTPDVIAYGSYYRIDEKSNVYGKSKRKVKSGYIIKYLFQTIIVHSCGLLIPREMLKKRGGFDTSMQVCSDYDCWLDLSTKYRFIATKEPTFKRRRHRHNLSTPQYKNSLTQYLLLKRFYYKKGGKELIPQKIAKKIFSKELRRLGRLATIEARPDHGRKLLKKSFFINYNFKSLLYWILAAVAGNIGMSNCCFRNYKKQ